VTALVNSRGLRQSFRTPVQTLWAWFAGPGGHMVEEVYGPGADSLDLDELRHRAAAREAFLATRPRPYEGPPRGVVVLGPRVTAQLARTTSALFTGNNVQRSLRPLLGRVGRQIASRAISLTDDARLRGALRSRPYDDEGTPTGRIQILAQGRLEGFLHTLRTADELGFEPNGAASRSQIDDDPIALPTNVYFHPGEAAPEALEGEVERGLVLDAPLQRGRIHSETGRFTIACDGWLVERGRRRRAVTDVRFSAQVFELLRSVRACADDLLFSALAFGAGGPTVLLGDMRFR
jgi:PmbA protein